MILRPEEIDKIHRELQTALEQLRYDEAGVLAESLSSSRVARVLREAPREAVLPFLLAGERRRAGRILGQLPPDFAAEILEATDRPGGSALLAAIPPDHAVDILQVLPDDVRDELLRNVDSAFRSDVETLSQHPAGSAGAHMTSRFLSVSLENSVGQTLDAIRSAPPELERSSYIYVTNGDEKPVGVVSLRDLLRFPQTTSLARAMNPTVVAVHVDDDAADAARLLRNRRFTMLPVLDSDGRIAGVITFDDAIDILSDDVAAQLAGMNAGSPEESFFTPPFSAVRMRLPWMAANILLNLGAVAVITGFEETIAAVAILAAFLPMITDMGGNVVIQSLSVAIRSIALGEVRLRDFWRAIRKELTIGLVNGLALGSIFTVVAFLWQRNAMIGAIAGVALGVNVLVAGVIGGTIPFLIKKLGRDPAMMTGPILTTITDITGVSIYLGLSTAFLLA
ncbi:MAG: magnesium transporter [Spirochaetaceae bacterium]|nr:MAG: magnesium transporter [Spirochaetaceae bacterium]